MQHYERASSNRAPAVFALSTTHDAETAERHKNYTETEKKVFTPSASTHQNEAPSFFPILCNRRRLHFSLGPAHQNGLTVSSKSCPLSK
jgi:hypothetical protein